MSELDTINDRGTTMWRMKELYVEWCLYSSLLLRELTLQGACSFGIFQLLRTLLDDFLLHSIKLSISRNTGQPCVSAMRDISNTNNNDT